MLSNAEAAKLLLRWIVSVTKPQLGMRTFRPFGKRKVT